MPQVPSPQVSGQLPQSEGHHAHTSGATHAPSPHPGHRAAILGALRARLRGPARTIAAHVGAGPAIRRTPLAVFRRTPHTPSPHSPGQAPQSAGQSEQVSPAHLPSPQEAHTPQSAGQGTTTLRGVALVISAGERAGTAVGRAELAILRGLADAVAAGQGALSAILFARQAILGLGAGAISAGRAGPAGLSGRSNTFRRSSTCCRRRWLRTRRSPWGRSSRFPLRSTFRRRTSCKGNPTGTWRSSPKASRCRCRMGHRSPRSRTSPQPGRQKQTRQSKA